MVITSSMLSFNTNKKLLACGIDSEHIERFTRLCTGEKALSPLIFSPKEIEHCFSLDNPSIGFCASFCCKEAMYKACKQPINFNTCELFWTPSKEKYHVTLPNDFYLEHKIQEAIAQVETSSAKECIVTVFLLG